MSLREKDLEEYGYSIDDLFEEAANDPSWEPDRQKRKELVEELRAALERV